MQIRRLQRTYFQGNIGNEIINVSLLIVVDKPNCLFNRALNCRIGPGIDFGQSHFRTNAERFAQYFTSLLLC